MGKYAKLLARIVAGGTDSNIEFAGLCQLLLRLGFDKRVKGDHHIFTRVGVVEIVNIQPMGNKAKAYQVKQIRSILMRYNLGEFHVD